MKDLHLLATYHAERYRFIPQPKGWGFLAWIHVKYVFDWGDGDKEYVYWYNTGDTVTKYHYWEEKGIYSVKVKTIDEHGLESEWSEPLSVAVPKNKPINTPFLQFLENHPQMFPLLRQLLRL